MRRIWLLCLVGILMLGTGLADAKEPTQSRDSLQKQEQVYGWQLMSEQERHEYQQRMREMKTSEQRETYRNQHHQRMQERAQQKGLALPDSPGSHRKGVGYVRGGKQ